jgi:hypothetical protein
MQGVYIYIPETNNVPREYIVAAILSLLFMVPLSLVLVLAVLYFYVSIFRSMCSVPNMAVFCSSLTHGLLECCSHIFWVILKWFQSLLLLLVVVLLLLILIIPIPKYHWQFLQCILTLMELCVLFFLLNTILQQEECFSI